MTLLNYIWVYLLGASLGSFFLVVVVREREGRSWIAGRSSCDSCGAELKAWDLIPTISYLSLGGKCRYCGSKIGFLGFFAETGLGIAFVALYYFALESEYLLCYTIVVSVLWKQVLSDMLYQEVDVQEVYIIAIIASLFTGKVPVTILFILLSVLLLHKDNFKYFGAGDIDILILMYASLGYGRGFDIISILLEASVLGLIFWWICFRKKGKKEIPFVPFLCMGYIMTVSGLRLI